MMRDERCMPGHVAGARSAMVRRNQRQEVDDAIRSAVDDVSIDRITNWCKHIRARQVLVSFLGQAMNLPIGPKEISCTHIGGGWQGMTYRDTARLFIEANCPDCQFHEPAAEDNIGQEILETARARRAAAETADIPHEGIQQLVIEGVDVDAVLAADVRSDRQVKSLVGLLGDESRKAEAAAKLLEVSRSFPRLISAELALVMTGAFDDRQVGAQVTEAVRLLIEHYPDELWPTAIDRAKTAMSQQANVDEAAKIVDLALAAGRIEPDLPLGSLLVSRLDPAVDSLLDRIGGGRRDHPAVTEAYVRLARLNYLAAAEAAQRALASEHVYDRAKGAAGVTHLLAISDQACVEFVDPLLDGLAMLDEEGDADPSLMRVLAACIAACPQAASDLIFERLPKLGADVGALALRSFTFDEAVEGKEIPWAGRFVLVVGDARLDLEFRSDVSDSVQNLSYHRPSALWPHFELMLGVLAQVSAEVDAVRSTRPKDDAVVTQQQFWEYQGRWTSVQGIAGRLSGAVAKVALLHPDEAIRSIDHILRRTDSKIAPSLKAGLLSTLGEMGQYAQPLAPSIVPVIFPHLVDPISPQIRAAAAEACGNLVTWNRDVLPEDVLLIVGSLLGDEYLQPVVGRAVTVFERARVDDVDLAAYILQRLAVLLHVYGKEPAQHYLARDLASSLANVARQHERFVPIVVTLLYEMAKNDYFYTAKDAIREFGWFVLSRPGYQGYYLDSLIDYYTRFKLQTSLRGEQYMNGPDDDAFENLYEIEPEVVRSRGEKLVHFARESGFERNLRHVATLLITFELNEEAAEAFDTLADTLPDEPRADWERHRCRGFASALRAEVALTGGDVDEAERLLDTALEQMAAGRAPKRKLPFGIGETDGEDSFYQEWLDLRRQWLGLTRDGAGLEAAAEALANTAEGFDRFGLNERESRIISLASDVLRAASLVGRWQKQLLAGDPTSAASRDAAIARLTQATTNSATLSNEDLVRHLRQISDQVCALSATSGIQVARESIRSLPLPFPRHDLPTPDEWRGSRAAAKAREAAKDEQRSRPSIAVAHILINEHEPPDVIELIAARFYDIRIRVDVANIPKEATHLVVTPVSSLRESDYAFPRQETSLKDGTMTYELNGQIMVSYAQSGDSSPLSIKLLAGLISSDGEKTPVELLGRRELRIRVYDDVERFRARGPAARDATRKLEAGLDELVPSLQDPNRADELEVAAALANYVDHKLRHASFRGQESEKDFENSLMEYMGYRFEERDDVYRQVGSGVGFIDGLVLGVPLELKVIKEGDLDRFTHASLPQATEYVVTQGRRVGFLIVLDLCRRDTPTPPIVDDVCVVRGVTERGLAPVSEGVIAIGVAVVRARVARPSDLKPPARAQVQIVRED